MASYKVPQDVEADDKILGPFSFRQFVYLLIVAAMAALAWLLFNLLPPLAIIPLPVILFFGALALPLRKDQPMEIYMAAILSFYLKPRQRLWDPDGIDTLVQIAAPRTTEPQRTKNVTGSEAENRLRYLSDLADSRGWSVRGVSDPATSLNPDVFHEAQQAQDILDEDSTVSRNLDHMIASNNQRRHTDMLNQFKTAAAGGHQAPAIPVPEPTQASPFTPAPAVQPIPDPYASLQTPTPQPQETIPTPQFNPYPSSINQSVIQPLSEQQQTTAAQPTEEAPIPAPEPIAETSAQPVSPDIIKLATNADLSIETIAREAHRITEKGLSSEDDEVVISLR